MPPPEAMLYASVMTTLSILWTTVGASASTSVGLDPPHDLESCGYPPEWAVLRLAAGGGRQLSRRGFGDDKEKLTAVRIRPAVRHRNLAGAVRITGGDLVFELIPGPPEPVPSGSPP